MYISFQNRIGLSSEDLFAEKCSKASIRHIDKLLALSVSLLPGVLCCLWNSPIYCSIHRKESFSSGVLVTSVLEWYHVKIITSNVHR